MKLFDRTFTRRARRASSYEIDPEDVFLDSQNVSKLNLDQMQGHLEKPLGRNIFYFLLLTIFLILFGFSYRLFSMQIVEGDTYKDKADKNHLRSTPIFALRGNITDRNGVLLAWNVLATSTDEVPRRKYTSLNGFSHLLGYVSYPKKDDTGVFWQDEYIGKDGIEKEYQDLLSGVQGERIIGINAKHEVESQNVTVYPMDGENLKLTVDAKVEEKLYESIVSLANESSFTGGSGVIMDIHTGEILAMASYPEYDNNIMTNAVTKEEKSKIGDWLLDKRHIFLNRVVGGLFTPGSTVKPFVAIAALMEDIITPEKQINSVGQLVIKNKYGGADSVFKDWKAHGWTDMRKALAESSDEYFYQVGGGYMDQPGLGIDRINKYANMFGFATTTGVDLPGENYGLVPSQAWKQKVFGENWLLGDTYHTAIGQYGFQITPLELVRAVSSIANGGYLVTPHFLSDLHTSNINLNIEEKDLKVVQEGMRQGVVQGIGTVLNIEGVKVASKSGTAELGVKKDLVNSWISGYFPYDNPKYAFVIIMEKGSRTNLHGAIFAMREVLEYMRDNTDYTK